MSPVIYARGRSTSAGIRSSGPGRQPRPPGRLPGKVGRPVVLPEGRHPGVNPGSEGVPCRTPPVPGTENPDHRDQSRPTGKTAAVRRRTPVHLSPAGQQRQNRFEGLRGMAAYRFHGNRVRLGAPRHLPDRAERRHPNRVFQGAGESPRAGNSACNTVGETSGITRAGGQGAFLTASFRFMLRTSRWR